MSSLSYKDAGVDLDQYAEAMDRLPALMRQTHSARVLPLAVGSPACSSFREPDTATRIRSSCRERTASAPS